MKKILILTLLFIVSFASMNFTGCNGLLAWFANNLAIGANGLSSPGLDGVSISFGIYGGEGGTIIRSTGENNIIFEPVNSGTTQRLNYIRISSSAFNPTVIAVCNNGIITRSTNTGETWTVSAAVTTANLYAVDFNSVFYYAAGDNGTILRSVTGGANWFQVTSGTTRNLKALSMNNQSGSNIIAVGEKGTILRTTDGGSNWVNLSLTDTTMNFYDITKKGLYYNSGNSFCAVGTGGRIYKSTDGGLTWVQKASGTTNTFRSIYQHTVDSAVVVGDNGTIRFTTNGGETWFTDAFFNSPSSRQYKSVSLVNLDNKTYSALSDTLFFISNEPLILGLNNINTAIPQTSSLAQNYPNPFNPSTKINFALPKSSSVQLIIYDILGKEVTKLVNEKLQAGTYEYEWNGINLPSGVYFYKLTAGNFSETRKMLLVK